ncbi:MAG: DUF4136 domain-containing protein [Acidobacteriota bacterium]|nr:DUF4136 domain-containing protein [Acidobacteriota bacterium]
MLIAVVAGSAAAQKVTVEFDQAGAFSDYKTFAIRDGAIHSKNPSLNNGIVGKNLEAEIRARLTAKGLTEVTAQPDLNVRYSLGSGQRTEVDRYPAGWRGFGTRVVRTHYTEGTLVIDMNDTRRHELVWRAIAIEDKSDPMKIQEHLADMVRKAIDKYPPKPK